MKKILLTLFSFSFAIIFSTAIFSHSLAAEKSEASVQEKKSYYQIKLNNAIAGWSIVTHTTTKQGNKVNNESLLRINRLGNTLFIHTIENIVTDTKQEVLSAYQKVNFGENNTTIFNLTISPTSNTQATLLIQKSQSPEEKKQITLTHSLITTQQVIQALKAKENLIKGDCFESYSFDFSTQSIIKTVYIYQESKNMLLAGQEQFVHCFKTQIQIGKSLIAGTCIFSKDFEILLEETDLAGLGLSQRVEKGDESVLKATLSEEDSIASSFITVPPTEHLLATNPKGLCFYVSFSEENNALKHFPSDHNIQIKQISPLDWKISTFNHLPEEKMSWPYHGQDPVALENLKATSTLEIQDSSIKKLAIKFLRNKEAGDDAYQAATSIIQNVAYYIHNKNYRNAYNSALQTLKSREGDCTEHSVLAVALCRSIGIPARPVFGVALTRQQEVAGHRKDVLIGHQWLEVWINGKWYPLDPALFRYSLCHIRLEVGDGSESDGLKTLDGYERIKGMKINKVEIIP